MNLLEAVIRLRRALSRAASASFGPELGTRHAAILRELRASGPAAQIRVARATAIDPSLVVRLLDDLEASGLVRRSRNESDRRVMTVTLTDDGRKALRPLDAAYKRLANAMERPLSPDERASFIALAERMIHSLDGTASHIDRRPEYEHASG
ncbi:MAG: MarR family transcriptional regulator [Polyangia bacterium]|jgi:DNA-binding MarR family transcriptional regulator